MIAFLIIHGRRSEGGRGLFIFVISVFVIGWTFETVSVLTGFPFGNYHYTEIMAPFLGHVPIFVMPAYCIMGYVCWSLARILLCCVNDPSDTIMRYGVPVAAALLMVLWDASMDPLRATVEGRWIWLDGGPHFGVPLVNYFGWFCVTWMMFQLFSILRERVASAVPHNQQISSRLFWVPVPLMYLAFPVEYVLNPLVAGSRAEAVLVNGASVPVAGIYSDISMLTVLTMVPVAVVAVFQLLRPRTLLLQTSRQDTGSFARRRP
ncbi:carotenoid biosynthesis protein [Hoeflea sp. TYP-13]|uniref:carotenoid biosynthesis protein n=1 Tax=Hoeflea sp. TYP-13 TaxID=3230023 RepID=UPI0034C5E8E2